MKRKSLLGRFSTVSVCGLVLVLSGGGVFADDKQSYYDEMEKKGGMMGHPGMMSSMSPMFKDYLKLNDQQSEQMHKLYSDYRKEMVRRNADIRVAEMDLAEMLEAKAINTAEIEKAVKKAESLRSDLTMYRIKALMKSKEFLTAEQFKMFRDYTAGQMRHSRHPMMEGGPMMGHGPMMSPYGMPPMMMDPDKMEHMMRGTDGTMGHPKMRGHRD